ncbi:MAG: M13 family metallopeptidase, partial [Chitinophagaceae bacterium]|nr:M13 family metallopeptidase [Chitinophagaceae bacterium]
KNRKEYTLHLTKMLYLLEGDSSKAKTKSTDIIKLETALASSHKSLDELRDPYANYHKITFNELNTSYPNLNWKAVFENLQIKADTLIVGQPQFFQKLNSLITSTPIETWKAYLTWHLLSSLSPYLSTQFDAENFHFYETVLNGTKEPRVRWKRVLDTQEGALGDAMGQLFVKEYFPEKTKKRYTDLVEQIVISYREHIQKLDWMSDSTKQKAIKKLNAITRKVGYPNTWKDYSSMEISRDSYCKNVMAANQWQFNYQLNKLGKPVDRNEWNMTPQTYNAYYNPSNNEIVLPAAIFTAPGYKDEDIDDAVIYGYVGASTIGHELTHGFDDEGRQFDEMGNLKNWWSKEDELKFKAKAAMLVEQFNQYTVLQNLHPNGKATLGENIADLGGIVIALDAFKKTKQYKEGKLIAGLTPIQRYFMGYAYGWMQTRTPEKVAARLLTDVHAPIFLRVNGPMSNCDEWYKAFNVGPTNSMYRDSLQRVRIW